MHKYVVYIDNFRGFHDAFIPFKEVNFLVGENSTGKTSVLTLMNILSDIGFYVSGLFFNKEVNLGKFHEITDGSEKEKKYFRIGMLRKIKIKNFDSYNSLLMTYKNDGGKPILSELVYSFGSFCVKILYKRESMQYKDCKNEITQALDPVHYFKTLIKHVDSFKGGFTKFNDSMLMDRKIDIKKSKSSNSIIHTLEFLITQDITKNTGNGTQGNIALALPLLTDTLVWIGPIRAEPESIYSSDSQYIERTTDGKHAPYVLRAMLTGKKDPKKTKFKDRLRQFGKESGMWEDISIKNYGRGKHSPFEIDIQIMDKQIKITNVGYGVSQILPVLTEFFHFFAKNVPKDPNFWLALQQPEIHLHPRAQAALGEQFFTMNKEHRAFFLIETHSEYILNRYRICQKTSAHPDETSQDNSTHPDKTSNAQVLFFERSGNKNKIHVIDIDEQGRYSEDQPESFGDFFIQEELRLLEV